MGRISIDRVLPLLVGQSNSGAMRIIKNGTHLEFVQAMIVLQYQMDHFNDQSFYFQMGVESHKAKLADMKSRYKRFVDFVNSNTESYFLRRIQELLAELQTVRTERPHRSFLSATLCHSINSNIHYYKDIIQIKSQFGKLKTIEEVFKIKI